MIKVTVITPEDKVCCLPGYENFDTREISKRMPRRRGLKSTTELRWEKELREGKINLLKGAS